MKTINELSTSQFSDVAYLDATRRAILHGLNAALVDMGHRYRLSIDHGRLLVGVIARRKERPWTPDKESREGVKAMIAVDYTHGDPEFRVMLFQPGVAPVPEQEGLDRWSCLERSGRSE